MPRTKRLQVFVSSTYTDLRDERQAAVEAILMAGHIPAGMELFAAGDESQMSVIRRWIDESDVFLLILGGRYGSIEPTSRKSYIHLEYEYAIEKGKPVFAVVIRGEALTKKVKKLGPPAMEADESQKLKEFRALVETKMVEFWGDERDIQLAVIKALSDFGRREELVGWVRGDEAANAAALADEMARLTKENAQLREQLAHSSAPEAMFNGLTFDQTCQLLSSEKPDPATSPVTMTNLRNAAIAFRDLEPTLLHAFWVFGDTLAIPTSRTDVVRLARQLAALGLTQHINDQSYVLSSDGKRFFARLMFELGGDQAKQSIRQTG
jgi:hypothetical protein